MPWRYSVRYPRHDGKYPSISKSWQKHRPNLITLFDYPDDTRKAIKKRKLFPNDESAMKVVYLAIEAASKKMDHADTSLGGESLTQYIAHRALSW